MAERAAVGLALWGLLAIASCSADSGGDSRRPSVASPAGNTAGASGASRAAAGTSGSNSGTALAGAGGRTGAPVSGAGGGSMGDEPCNPRGATRTCCGTGVQTCMGSDEFPTWGPCIDGGGATITCSGCGVDEFVGCDAGTPPPPQDAGGPPPPSDAGNPPDECGPGMECRPGSVRYCDVFGFEWSKSTCDATGHWGECVETTIPAAADGAGCAQDDYAPELCCPVAVICCQDNPSGPFLDFGSGACVAISCP